jgi:hypothetical protein
MRKWLSGLVLSCVLTLSGCGIHGAEPVAGASDRLQARQDSPAVTEVAEVKPAQRAGERRESRTVEDDRDADGIADYRVIITDTFDADGNLLLTTRDEDFEADGIFDARSLTKYGD